MTRLEKLQSELERLEREVLKRQQNLHNCDYGESDCFMSVHFNSLNTQLVNKKIEILKNGGFAHFPALYYLNGELACDTLVRTKYGLAFPVDKDGRTEWVSFDLTEKTYTKKGYKLDKIKKPAWAKITGGGMGMAGVANCYIVTFPSDTNYAEDAEATEE